MISLRSIFRKAAPRFIRIDGAAWDSTGLGVVFQTAAGRVTAATLAATTAFGISQVEHLHGAAYLLTLMADTLVLASAAQVHSRDANLFMPFLGYRFAQYPIDREGRAVPPANMPELLAEVAQLRQRTMNSIKRELPPYGGIVLAAGAIAAALQTTISPMVGMMLVGPALPLAARHISLIRRCQKILNDEYRLSGSPPPNYQTKASRLPVARAQIT